MEHSLGSEQTGTISSGLMTPRCRCLVIMHSAMFGEIHTNTPHLKGSGLVVEGWGSGLVLQLQDLGNFQSLRHWTPLYTFFSQMWGHLSSRWNWAETGSLIPNTAENRHLNVYIKKKSRCWNGHVKVQISVTPMNWTNVKKFPRTIWEIFPHLNVGSLFKKKLHLFKSVSVVVVTSGYLLIEWSYEDHTTVNHKNCRMVY